MGESIPLCTQDRGLLISKIVYSIAHLLIQHTICRVICTSISLCGWDFYFFDIICKFWAHFGVIIHLIYSIYLGMHTWPLLISLSMFMTILDCNFLTSLGCLLAWCIFFFNHIPQTPSELIITTNTTCPLHEGMVTVMTLLCHIQTWIFLNICAKTCAIPLHWR